MSFSKQTTCNLCGSPERDLFFREQYQEKIIRAVKCQRCGLIYIHPQPPDFIPDFDEVDPGGEEELARSKRVSYYRRWLTRLKDEKKTGRLLDIGCGTGVFLEAVREHPGYNPEGLEPTGQFVTICQGKRLSVSPGTIESAIYSDDLFDIITMWDVLEHLPNPLGTLLEVTRILKPGGIILIKVPNIRSLNLKCARWFLVLRGRKVIIREHPLRHLFFYSTRTLGKMVSTAGLEVIETETEESAFSTFSQSRLRREIKRFLQIIYRIFPGDLNDEIVLIARKP